MLVGDIISRAFNKLADAYKSLTGSLARCEKAQVGSIISIIVVVVTLMLAVLVVAPLQQQAGERVADLNDTDVSATFDDVKESTWGSLSTASIIPYVIVFIVILGLIVGLGSRRD